MNDSHSPELTALAATEAEARCPNCGAITGTRYCGECGQRIGAQQLTVRKLVGRAIASATELDRGFLFTLWRLTVRPAVVVQEYLSGPRVRYTSPRRYMLVIAAATTVVWLLLDATAEFRAGMTVALGEDAPADAQRIVEIFGTLLTDHLNLLILAAVPFSTAASWLCFRPARKKLAEHLVFNTYTFSLECLLITLFLIAGWAGAPEIIRAMASPVGMAYWVWAAIQFFGCRWAGGLVRAIAATVLNTVVYWVALLTAVIGYVMIT